MTKESNQILFESFLFALFRFPYKFQMSLIKTNLRIKAIYNFPGGHTPKTKFPEKAVSQPANRPALKKC